MVIQQGTRVCLHGSQARVKSTDPGPNHHLHNNKIKKILTPFFAVFCQWRIDLGKALVRVLGAKPPEAPEF
jgi:hypothetical protein